MKRYLFVLLLVGILAVLLVACQDPQNTIAGPESTDTSSSAEVTTTTPTTTLDTLAEEKRAEIEALMKKDIARAEVIGNATVNRFGKYLGAGLGYRLSEKYNTKTGAAQGSSSVWHYTSYYAMLSRLIDITEKSDAAYNTFTTLSDQVYAGFEFYSGTGNIITYLGTKEVTLYGVNRSNKKNGANIEGDQMVYDDQMWIIRENIYRYKQTKDETYLNEAKRLSVICINGWDYSRDKDGNEYGGIPWGPFYSSKHTCSNGPIVMPLVEIYEILKEKGDADADYFLDWAKKIYAYTKENLKNPNNLYGDSVGYVRVERTGSDGKKYYETRSTSGADGKEYTYNTGTMISGACALYRVTGTKTYFYDAKNAASAAYRNFAKKSGANVYYPNDTQTIWFNLVLLQGFLDYYALEPDKADDYILSFQKWLDNAFDNFNKDGFLPRDTINGWYQHSGEAQHKYDELTNVMDQASYSQMYAMLALWHQTRLLEDDAKIPTT